MSETDSAEIIAAQEASKTITYIITALTSLVAYDYIITIPQEITAVWKRKFSIATLLFVINRYLMVLSILLAYVVSTPKNCTSIQRASEVVSMAQLVVFAFFSAFRVYALWNHNRVLFALVLSLGLVPVVINTYAYSSSVVTYGDASPNEILCFVSLNLPPLALASRLSVTAADIVVMLVTCIKTVRVQREAIRLNMKAPIITLLLRDGTLYFLLILFMNVAEIMVETVNGASALSPVSEFLALIPPILISRFLLNLRQIDNDDDEEAEVTHVSTLGFRASVSVGNMGESLDHGPAEYDDAGGEPEDSFDDPIDHSVDADNEVYSLSEITPR